MAKPLTRTPHIDLFHYEDGDRVPGVHSELTGDCSGIRGDCTWIYGDCTGLSGDCTGLRGNVSGVEGNLDEISTPERLEKPNLSDWIG